MKLGVAKSDRLYTSVLVPINESCLVLKSEQNKQLNVCISLLFLIFSVGDLIMHLYCLKILFKKKFIIVICFGIGFLVRKSSILDNLSSFLY